MRQIMISALCLLMAFPIVAQEDEPAVGEVIVETRQLAPFETLRVARGINVTLVEGEKPKAEVHIMNADPEDVLIEQSNKDLTIRMRTRIYRNMAVNVYLYYQNIKEISAGTGGSVYSDDVIEAKRLVLDAGTDASIQFEIEVDHLEVSASAGRVEVMGTANTIDVNLSTGGRFNGANLETKKAKVRANTGAGAEVWVTEELEARAASGARIEYTGDPQKIEVRTSLGGRVQEME
ncbi:head GIN domain-containing protein [Natronoflexus pectinivorans]|uniref:Putative autotransporter adhesin-like protein n=1 Tax=Natronoflexus pectinivorans TaxID=682526 RepID=A0A4R2GNC2_9BACT|nr:head GIN domain-containing protein [Natronoflexus pectinivorans]TCO09195.1 putative autotransporter adhesin-like protein [Natronoflexus pectinivorans]